MAPLIIGYFSVIISLYYSLAIPDTSQPYVRIDWTPASVDNDGAEIDAYTIDYFPIVGHPSPPIRLPPTATNVDISNTLPATMYTVGIIAEFDNGRRSILFNGTVPSSPEPPLLDTMDIKATEITVQLFPSDSEDVTYLANYSSTANSEFTFSDTSVQPLITLSDLKAGTEYNISIFAVFNGVYSRRPYHTTIKTSAQLSTLLDHSATLVVSPVSQVASTAVETEDGYEDSTTLKNIESSIMAKDTGDDSSTVAVDTTERSTTMEESTMVVDDTQTSTDTTTDRIPTSIETTALATTSMIPSNYYTGESSTVVSTIVAQDGNISASYSTRLLSHASTSSPTPRSITSSTNHPIRTWSTEPSSSVSSTNGELGKQVLAKHSTGGSSWKGRKVQAVRKPSIPNEDVSEKDEEEELDSSDEDETNRNIVRKKGQATGGKRIRGDSSIPSSQLHNFSYALPPEIMAKLPDTYGRPRSVDYTPEGRQLRITWQHPEGADCNGYLVNYTLTTLHTPKSFQIHIESDRAYALVKMFLNNVMEVEIYCLSNDSIVSKTPARATVDLRKPEAIKNQRVSAVLTDEFFRSSILLEWDWPANYSNDQHSIVVSYHPGKAKKLKSQTVTVNETGSLNISGLKPTETYTFMIKNISRLNIQSATVGVKQIMPPIVESTLLPGKITSNSLLITYSPTDVDEARFDSYHLLACFSDTVNRTFIKSKADPNRNFLLKNLIPGQTYTFYLYTVYKKVRSRPIMANFTTYPLKVKNLFSIVRRNAIKLFYEPEESPLKEIRYKLSFTGSDGSESDAVTVLNQLEYVFDYLKPDIWYTFSVTVLMGDQESESTAKTILTGLNSDPVPHIRGSTPTTIDIAFRRDIFTESNGVITNYSIIVAEDYRLDYFNYSVLSWRSVQNFETWPLYTPTPPSYNPFKNPRDEATTYTIGIDTCDHSEPGDFCNGPLKPHTEYFIKLRACTNQEICMETSYTKAATEKDTSSPEARKFLNPHYHSGTYSEKIARLSMHLLFLTALSRLLLSCLNS